MKTKFEALTQPSSILQGKQIYITSLDMFHIKFSITPRDKDKYQRIFIKSMQIKKSDTNYNMINNQIPKSTLS